MKYPDQILVIAQCQMTNRERKIKRYVQNIPQYYEIEVLYKTAIKWPIIDVCQILR